MYMPDFMMAVPHAQITSLELDFASAPVWIESTRNEKLSPNTKRQNARSVKFVERLIRFVLLLSRSIDHVQKPISYVRASLISEKLRGGCAEASV